MDSSLVAVTGGLIICALIAFALVSLNERERQAAGRALGVAVLTVALYGLSLFFDVPFKSAWNLLLVAAPVGLLLIYLIPVRTGITRSSESPAQRIDERDIMFSRKLYEPGSARYEEYYRRRPEFREKDDAFRQYPGLLSAQSNLYEPFTFRMADSIFNMIKELHPLVSPPPGEKAQPRDSESVTRQIKSWLMAEGCVSAGIAELRDYHYYSHIGRGDGYGQPVEPGHQYGVAFTVEMDKGMMDSAPQGPTVLESARQYLNAAVKALQLTRWISDMGYEARAHIDGNYRVVCPLVARDAGLGEIGRMGLLMTPQLGPRVRIGVVTTNMPLTPDERRSQPSMLHFCRICKKCAQVCPAQAIPMDDRQEISGVRRWQINQEACYTLWCKMGTDCGRCMAVCPYSHPDTMMHNIVRSGIRRSIVFARLALWLDDFFYGRKQRPKPFPKWLRKEMVTAR